MYTHINLVIYCQKKTAYEMRISDGSSDVYSSDLRGCAAQRQGWNDYAKASLGFSWEIDFWGKNRAALKAATSEAWAAEADVATARLMISTAIASSYADLARLYADRDVLAATATVREPSPRLVRARPDHGLPAAAALTTTLGQA